MEPSIRELFDKLDLENYQNIARIYQKLDECDEEIDVNRLSLSTHS